MEKKVLLVLFLLCIFLIPTVFAATTNITVKTKPYNKVFFTIMKAGITPSEKIDSSHTYKSSGLSGMVSYSFTTTESKFDLKLEVIKDDSTPVTNKIFPEVAAGTPVLIDFVSSTGSITTVEPAPVEILENSSNSTSENSTSNETVSNETASNSTESNESFLAPAIVATANTINNSSNFSLNFSFSPLKFFKDNSKTFIYILITIVVIIIIAVVIIFLLYMKNNYMRKPSYPVTFRHKEQKVAEDRGLADAERKLKSAQEEIEKIKHKEQLVRDAEKKLEEDRIRLQRLRRNEF